MCVNQGHMVLPQTNPGQLFLIHQGAILANISQRPRLSQEQVQKLWDRRTSSRKKLVRVPTKIAELVEETEFEGLSDVDYEAGPAVLSDRGDEKQSQTQRLVSCFVIGSVVLHLPQTSV